MAFTRIAVPGADPENGGAGAGTGDGLCIANLHASAHDPALAIAGRAARRRSGDRLGRARRR